MLRVYDGTFCLRYGREVGRRHQKQSRNGFGRLEYLYALPSSRLEKRLAGLVEEKKTVDSSRMLKWDTVLVFQAKEELSWFQWFERWKMSFAQGGLLMGGEIEAVAFFLE